ncbi:probable LRR receptor-like serine/threonine-protein kinase At3g47570 [Hibiscus syriacus]|uniref:probable LRR receptor-like serine/threonine-protein kinase At3g47570 n=1 Tax=Hibiscus syriacus TaxID=106335 RepID=UPI00192180F8|nr:probable LRR receptor-like serine/threonine-protein kinase At3g47570 [Hibiscus syriacus]
MGSKLSTKGDVYSYGILLLEMFTGKRPTDEMFKEGLSLHNFVSEAFPDRMKTVADNTLNENSLGNDNLQCLNLIFEIRLTCSAESPSKRMGMSDVVTKLCSARDKLLRPTRFCHEIQTAYAAQSSGYNGLNALGIATATTTLVVTGNDTDQQALLQFKAKITCDQLNIMESWNSSIHFCQWRGVTCGRKHQRVTKLEMQFLKLSGFLTPYIGNLSFLRELSLVGNSFYKEIPQEIGRLRRLETLDLTNNSISGEIPSNLSACSKLTVVDMRKNQLTGEIPASLGLLSNLKILSFGKSNLRGSIPPSLGNLSSMEDLYLAMNGLTGTIPEALVQLTNLSFFLLEDNAISGTLPSAIFNLSNVRNFDIGHNKIQGTLHSNLEISMPNVEFFSIAKNQINGQIPISISNASNLNVLQVDDNRLSGSVPSLENLDKLSYLLLGLNPLGYGREGYLNFLYTLVNKTELEFLYISGSNFGGVLPGCITNFSRSLLHLVIENNKILGRVPDAIENLINLEVLVTSRNQLSGPIPFSIGRLQKLKIFYNRRNFHSGTIPHSIGNLIELTKLLLDGNNLQGNIPSSLGKCQNLLEMDLSNNHLSGPIPHQVLGLSSLSIVLNLSSNFLTGELPVEVEKLIFLSQLDVSQNRLSCLLPNELGSCIGLDKLFLDGNLFEGPIPSSLRSLRGLEALDISDNNLSGGVPEFLQNFGKLKYLNLSFNDFEGVLPSEGVFKNVSATFVEGNNKLCGGISELQLPRCNSKTSKSKTFDVEILSRCSSKTSKSKLKIAIIGVTLGVGLVFTCLLIFWFRKKKAQTPTSTCVENSLLQLSYQSILRATDRFATQNLVGSGSFGSVYKGILDETGATIALKVLNLLNRGASRSFLAECEALKNIRHRNLVKVLTAVSGVDYKGNDFKALVYEFMENGNLEGWLHPSITMNEPETMRNMNFFQRVDIAIDVAHALEYLHHHCETSIIHCDLKPSNILLDEEMVGHISDFGLAKVLYEDNLNHPPNQSSSIGLRGTIGYAPPEYGMGSELSTKGDVYSYGILLLEMFTRKMPTDEMFKEGLSLHSFVAGAFPNRIIEIIDPILLQESVRGVTAADITPNENSLGNDGLLCLNLIFEIGLTCSAESPSERMGMGDVVIKLCSVRDKLLRPTRFH